MSDVPGDDRPFDEGAFRKLAHFSPDALIAHREGLVLWANDAAARLTGYASGAALVGRRILSLVAPESLEVVKERLQRADQASFSMPYSLLRTDGERVPVEVSSTPMGDGLLLATAHDLRPRLKAEQERTTAEARARAFFDATTEAMGISREGLHVQVNAAYASLFGYGAPAELVGVPIFDLLDPAEHPRIAELVRRRARGEATPSNYPVTGVRRDGSKVLLEVQASGYPDGAIQTTIVVMRDVTAQREFERRLAASEQRHRELFHQVPVGVWELDLSGTRRLVDELAGQGVSDFGAHFAAHPEDVLRAVAAVRVLSVNEAACDLVGAKGSEELVAHLDRFVHLDWVPELALALGQLTGGQRVVTTEGWLRTTSGERRWVALRATPVGGHEDDWSRVLVTTADMTERKNAREEKAHLQDQLRHAEKLEAIGRLAGGVAHDFNNLLAVILSSAEVSLLEAPAGSAREGLSLIREASLRAADLVQQILTFGRKDRPSHTPLDISETVTLALGLARAAIPASIQLDVSVAPNVGTVIADRTQLHQVVLNLCSNARDAVKANGHISVELDRVEPARGRGAQARLRVRDDGVGMDEALRARLFEPYLTTKQSGHGLGLAVVHGIVAAAGGSIQVLSAPGKGTTFEICLPLVEAAPAPAPKVTSAPGQHERVLLVDDQPLVRASIRRLLVSLGYRVTEASDGQEALERLRAGPGDFDLVISDQTMPRLTGLELARTLNAEGRGPPLILCSGYSEVLNEAAGLPPGVCAVLAKPVDLDSMSAAVRRALGTPPRG